MHLMWKQMEQVVKDALQREGLTIEERLGMIVTAMDARRLPYDAARIEKIDIPVDIEYRDLRALSMEAREKLSRIRPTSLGQAARIPGLTPADIQSLLILLEQRKRTSAVLANSVAEWSHVK